MHRLTLQTNAMEKLRDAQLLLGHGRHANAYYLAGYAVELALKACIARQIASEAIPDKQFILSIFDHNLTRLVKVAGLEPELKARQRFDTAFGSNWGATADWRPDSRYETIDPSAASVLVSAIADPDHGVLEWIKAYW